MSGQEIIKTSQPGWAKVLATNYKKRRPFTLQDDAGLGIDPAKDSLFQMLKEGSLSRAEVAGVLLSLGLAGIGARVITLAIVDPEPVTKVALTLGGLAVSSFGVGNAFLVLTRRKPGTVEVTSSGFKVSWA